MSTKKRSKKRKTSKKRAKNSPAFKLPSGQSMEGFLSGIGGNGRRDAPAEAQQIMYDAWEAPTPARAVALAKKALTISADCADAFNLLAEMTAKSVEEALDLYTKAVAAGERALGEQTFKEQAGHFWGLLETRPYMRARAALAESLWAVGRREEAITHFQDLLRLNPNDNQGIRDLLMPRLIELGRDKEAEKLFRAYQDDGMATWMYSRALLDFRRHGDSPSANASLQSALEANKHVPSYLLGQRQIPRNLPDHYGFGDVNEAVIYAHENQAAWRATQNALEWLAAKMN